jgi:hypothetical protein
MDKSPSLGMPMSPKKYPRSISVKAWGCPKAPSSSSTKISGHLSRYYIFIASYAMCFSWSVFIFCFQFYFILFAAINGWTRTYFFWRRHTLFLIA